MKECLAHCDSRVTVCYGKYNKMNGLSESESMNGMVSETMLRAKWESEGGEAIVGMRSWNTLPGGLREWEEGSQT